MDKSVLYWSAFVRAKGVYMRKIVGIAVSGLFLSAGAALAEGPRVYAYPGENFCPTGLQPVTISGVISCGTPNQKVSYSAMKATPGS